MRTVENRELMRAILHHSLDAINDVKSTPDTIEIVWYLRDNYKKILIAKETNKRDYTGRKYDNQTEVTDDFKTRYIDTMPADVWRCKSCAKRDKCDIIREDLNQCCLGWKSEQMPR